jgi:integrase/recombinase XerD
MKELFEEFIRERRYLRNLSEKTLTFYREVYSVFDKEGAWDNLSKQSLLSAIVAFRERGVKVGAVNSYIRGASTFLVWLAENGHIEPIKLKKLREEQKVLRSLTEAELKAIYSFKPKYLSEKRVHTILLMMMDTGVRINEALTLKRSNIDFDNLLMLVYGKGNKERIIPFSYELRKILYRHIKTHRFELVFANRDGGKLRYDNVRRDLNLLKERLKITDTGGAFHPFRRTFSTNFIKQKGNPLVLQRLLGHTTLQQTNQYVKMVVEDLQEEQQRTSLLSKLRS